MKCPVCGKEIQIETKDRQKALEELTKFRTKLSKLDNEIKGLMERLA